MTAVPHFKLRLLGPFQLNRAADAPIPLRRKTRALLSYLAVTDRAHSRRALMDLFCQEAQAPARALSLLLTRIRQHLGTAVLTTHDDTIQLNMPAAGIDFVDFSQQLSGDLRQKSAAELETAVALYHGEFLEGLTLPDAPEFELWLLGQRAQARQLLERGLLALVQQLSESGEFDTAVSYAQQLLLHNPLLEKGHAQLIQLYARTGQREVALAQYERCRTLLQTELGVEPAAELQQLRSAIASGEAGWVNRRSETAVLPIMPAPSADFVGRADGYARLQAAWHNARAGQGSVLLLSAPAGGGKTRLVQEFMRHLPAAAVYTGCCYESTRGLSYQPWLEILEAHGQQLDSAGWQQLAPATQAYIARLLPGITWQWSMAQSSLQVVDEPERLLTAVVDFLAQSPFTDRHPKQATDNGLRVTDDGFPNAVVPRLLFIDDLQWADEASLRLLHYVSQRISRFPWLLVGAFRSEEMADVPALATLLDDLARRGAVRLTLPPLTTGNITALTAHIWSRLAPGYRGHIADMLSQATGGNALFVTAVLQELALSDHIPAELPVPVTVQDLIQRRLRRLPSGSRQVLETLAVWGGPAALAQLQQISVRSEEEVSQALEWGLQWGLVVGDTAVSPIIYQFHHDLVREAIYATLTMVRKQRLHQRTAQWLGSIAPRQHDAVRQELAARILYHARRGEAFDLVFHWAPLAAAHARRTLAYREAVHALDALRDAFAQLQFLPNFAVDAAEPIVFEQMLWWLSYSWVLEKTNAEKQAVWQQVRSLLARHPSPLRTAQFSLGSRPSCS
ncbi:MAG: AAA family ATPase [Ardenticatenaceae bacterium]|nr:AAA family ATPase [Ardenticatenaceae bacterium]